MDLCSTPQISDPAWYSMFDGYYLIIDAVCLFQTWCASSSKQCKSSELECNNEKLPKNVSVHARGRWVIKLGESMTGTWWSKIESYIFKVVEHTERKNLASKLPILIFFAPRYKIGAWKANTRIDILQVCYKKLANVMNSIKYCYSHRFVWSAFLWMLYVPIVEKNQIKKENHV